MVKNLWSIVLNIYKKYYPFLFKHRNIIAVLFLLVTTTFLRFRYLDYSDYISDEPGTFLYRGDQTKYNLTTWEFLLRQRKGPLQIAVAYIPYLLVGNYSSEIAQRIPFALFNVASVLVLYLFISKVTKNKAIGFVSAFLFATNGFILAFGRIAQYQSLNMFFSFTALYLYSGLISSKKNLILKTSLGTAMFCLSLLAHWDAIYILPLIIYFFSKFLLSKEYNSSYKIKLLLINLVVGSLLLLWFLIPYAISLAQNVVNQEYLEKRFGLRDNFSNLKNINRWIVYNPFLSIYFYPVTAFIGALFSKKYFIFTLWVVFIIAIYTFFVPSPGTHIYNAVAPLAILSAIGIVKFIKLVPTKFKLLPVFLTIAALGFFYIQSYLILVDHRVEYPWKQEKILWLVTRKYTHEDKLNHKIGFPLKRYWRQISDFVNEQNEINNESCNYDTNEEKTLSKFYMQVPLQSSGCIYAIGIKRPLSFANDYKFPQYSKKKTVLKIDNEYGTTVVNIYKVLDRVWDEYKYKVDESKY